MAIIFTGKRIEQGLTMKKLTEKTGVSIISTGSGSKASKKPIRAFNERRNRSTVRG